MLKEISILASNYAYYMLNLSFYCVSDWCLNFSFFAAESCLTWLIHGLLKIRPDMRLDGFRDVGVPRFC